MLIDKNDLDEDKREIFVLSKMDVLKWQYESGGEMMNFSCAYFMLSLQHGERF